MASDLDDDGAEEGPDPRLPGAVRPGLQPAKAAPKPEPKPAPPAKGRVKQAFDRLLAPATLAAKPNAGNGLHSVEIEAQIRSLKIKLEERRADRERHRDGRDAAVISGDDALTAYSQRDTLLRQQIDDIEATLGSLDSKRAEAEEHERQTALEARHADVMTNIVPALREAYTGLGEKLDSIWTVLDKIVAFEAAVESVNHDTRLARPELKIGLDQLRADAFGQAEGVILPAPPQPRPEPVRRDTRDNPGKVIKTIRLAPRQSTSTP
jgi:hypothetical protein